MLLATTTDLLTARIGFEKAVDLLADAGYDAVDFSAFSEEFYTDMHDRNYYANIRKRAEDKGLIFTQSHAPFISSGHRDKSKCDNHFDNIVGAMRNASYLGVQTIVVHPFQFMKYLDDGNPERLFEYNMEYFSRLIPYCEEFEIKIALENLWQYQTPGWNKISHSVCAKPAELIRYIDTLNNDCFVACLDIGHAILVCQDVTEFIKALGSKRLMALHVHDVDGNADTHTLPYFGMTDWDKVTKALAEIDYKGNITYEADNFFKGKPKELYLPCAEFMVKTGRYLINKIEEYKKKG